MIKEAYCSKEVSILLKEKGFDIPVNYEYHYKITIPQFHRKKHNFNGIEYHNCSSEWYSAPTHQMAMTWLREVHKIFIEIGICMDLNGNYHYAYTILDKDCKYVRRGYTDFDWNYEDTVEAALKYVLENLIMNIIIK